MTYCRPVHLLPPHSVLKWQSCPSFSMSAQVVVGVSELLAACNKASSALAFSRGIPLTVSTIVMEDLACSSLQEQRRVPDSLLVQDWHRLQVIMEGLDGLQFEPFHPALAPLGLNLTNLSKKSPSPPMILMSVDLNASPNTPACAMRCLC